MSEPPHEPVDPVEPVDLGDETIVRDEWAGETLVVEEREEVVPQRRMPVIWPWLLAFLLLVLGGLGAYYYFSQKDESTVPAVVGQRQAGAEATVREAGFKPRSEPQESSKPRGVVLDQSPDAGTTLEDGKTVLLTVSAGPPRETVPDVVGETSREAVADVTAASFEADLSQAFSDKKAGTVIRQDPAPGANLKEGSSVALTVSKGLEPVKVPDVVGTTSSEATATLRDAGLDANVVPVPSDKPAGTVLAQSPAAGATAKSGTKVRLNVAQAPDTTTPATTAPPPATTQATTTTPPPTAPPAKATVPDVVGQDLADAARAFGDEGLKVAVKLVPSQEQRGKVIAQAQPPGTERKRGDTVQINVAIGPDPPANVAVPQTAGLAREQARQRLEDAQFEVLVIDFATTDRTREGKVLSQTPTGGAQIPQGSLVILYVGAPTS